MISWQRWGSHESWEAAAYMCCVCMCGCQQLFKGWTAIRIWQTRFFDVSPTFTDGYVDVVNVNLWGRSLQSVPMGIKAWRIIKLELVLVLERNRWNAYTNVWIVIYIVNITVLLPFVKIVTSVFVCPKWKYCSLHNCWKTDTLFSIWRKCRC